MSYGDKTKMNNEGSMCFGVWQFGDHVDNQEHCLYCNRVHMISY